MERRIDETVEEYIERIPEFAREKSGLNKVREFLGLLGNPDRDFQIFHVAGTNGKGSVCAFLSAVLKEAGIPFAAFTSPHLVDLRERFSINGEMVGEGAFEATFETVYEAVGNWEKAGNLHPTYFEFLFYMGLVMARSAKVKVLVLETGMGGLKDVTNVVERPLVSIIASISVDHTGFLGNTLEEIAVHKAGIIKEKVPVVYDGSCPAANPVIEERIRACSCEGERVDEVPWTFEDGGLKITCPYDGKPQEFRIPFAAPYQARNSALAIRALELSGLQIGETIVQNGIKKAHWPARMEQIMPNVYLDGAHNEDGIRAFLEAACLIKEKTKPTQTKLLFAVSSDKDYRSMLKEIGEQLSPELCVLTRMESKRALPARTLYEEAKALLPDSASLLCFENTHDALEEILSGRTPDVLIFIAGSLYLAGEIKKEFYHD